MKHTFTIASAIATAAVAVMPFATRADGLMIPPPEYYVYETGQEAVIFFEDGRESMLLTAEFRGNAKDFAWLVPTPSLPTVERGNWEMFVALRDITEVPVEDLVLGGYGSAPFAAETYVDKAAVREIERKSVGYYDIAVLEARTTEALLEWFEENGFTYPETGTYILDDYISAGWYFTAVKLNTKDSETAAPKGVASGNNLPLIFQFDTDKMVFPMQLSQVAQLYAAPKPESDSAAAAGETAPDSARSIAPEPWPSYDNQSVGVTLYLIDEQKQSLPGFTEQYAGFITADAVRELSYGTDGEPMFDPNSDDRYVLTKLYRSFPVAEMTYDLYPRDEENTGVLNDDSAIASEKSVWIVAGVAGVVVIVLIGAIVMMSRDASKKEKK